jgi:tRNA(fMet)-specific endonuclease VapC
MYLLDTDHASLYQQGHPALGQRLNHLPPNQVATSVITYDEQVSGRLAVVRKARNQQERINAYYWLQRTLHFFCRMPVLPFDEAAATQFQQLTTLKLRIGTQDLLIASIALANEMTLLTRNLRDFQKIPGLALEDCSLPQADN